MSAAGAGAASAEDAVRAFRTALPGTLVETDLSAFDATGAAVWSVALLGAPDGADGPAGGNGIGYGSDRAAARASAHGELVEWTRSHAVLSRAQPRRASWAELVASGTPATDPRTLCLPAGSSWTPQTPLDWLATTRPRDGADVLVPVDLLLSRPVDRPAPRGGRLVTPITNGLGAGLHPDRALAHALLELVQRDGNGLVFRALDRGAVLDLGGAADDPGIADVLARLRAAGVEPLVKLASTEFGVAGVYAVGRDAPGAPAPAGPGSEPLVATAIGEAAHPDAVAAVRKALLELCSSRARKAFAHGGLDRVRALAGADYLDAYLAALTGGWRAALADEEPRALDATTRWLGWSADELGAHLHGTLFAERTRTPLADLPRAPALRDGESAAGLLAAVTGALGAAGLDVLVLDLSGPPGSGVSAVKAVVPGLEVETMSYGRIGERGVARALALGLPFVRVGARPATAGRDDGHDWQPVLLTPEATERLGGPAWLDRADVDARVGELYPLYREPGRHLAPLARERGWSRPAG